MKAEAMPARIQMPSQARRGEIIEIRVLIQHPMETGYRRDDLGQAIPRNVIKTVWCRYNGDEVFRAELSSGTAANPYLQFCAVADASGDVEIEWVDDANVRGSERASIVVTG
jgi:sulfur-oxidizing protein SoxZ